MIKTYVTSEGGTLNEVNEEYFTIKMPNKLVESRFTYKPEIAREQGIELVARGTGFFESLIRECLKDGAICHAEIQPTQQITEIIRDYFKTQDYSCDDCEKLEHEIGISSICTANPPCIHRINNSEIRSIKIVSEKPFTLFQFYYTVLFQNKLKKLEEKIQILTDEKATIHNSDLLSSGDLLFKDTDRPIPKQLFDLTESFY